MNIYCPNCVPDFVNGYIKKPLLDSRLGCEKCGMGYNGTNLKYAIQDFCSLKNPDHLCDYIAVRIAIERGEEGIHELFGLGKKWRTSANRVKHNRGTNLMHSARLAWLALYCDKTMPDYLQNW